MPGKPAARIGDMTAHGGVIVGPGAPTVLIGGKPAAVVGDNHTCPLVNPGVPPPPHVGGPIMPPGVPTVLIGGKPAACVGDMVTCSGPPDSIIPPGCPTVLIGAGGGGGGGAGMGKEVKLILAQTAAMTVEENHKLDVRFVDKGGKPITGIGYTIESPDKKTVTGTLAGPIKKSGLKEGDYKVTLKTITKAEWSEKQARIGDKVRLIGETAGIESGEEAVFEIFIRDTNFADHQLTTLEAKVDGGKIEMEWELRIDDGLIDDQDSKEEKGGYSHPVFYFVVKVGGISARSAILEYKDFVEIELKDGDGNTIGEAGYKLFLPDGVIKEGTLDSNGYAKVDNIPPGRVKVMFDTEAKGK